MGRKPGPSARSTRVSVIDGRDVTERCCSRCRKWKPQTTVFFGARKRDHQTRRIVVWDAYCRPCRAAYARERWARLSDEQRRAVIVAQHARTMGDPERAARARETKRESERRRRADPEGRERAKAAQRRWYERMKRDRGRYEAYLERHRMNYRLRQERAGRSLDEIDSARALYALKADTRGKQTRLGQYIDAQPILGFVRAFQDANGLSLEGVCSRLEIEPRTYFAWREGERKVTNVDVADGILSRAGVGWLLYALYPELDTAGLRIVV